MCNKKRFGFWSLENCIIDAKNYTTRSMWRKSSAGAYDSAIRNRWLKICCEHMIELQKPNGYWSLEKCIEDAKRFKTTKEWRVDSLSYHAAKRNGWLNQCNAHMIKSGTSYKRLIYAFEFPDNSVYVGLTYNSENRKKMHFNSTSNSPVYKHYSETKLIPEYKELTEFLDKTIASREENLFVEKYRKLGWRILNIAKPGALGGGYLFWTKERCVENALKYKTRSEWARKSSGAYDSAHRNCWLEECCKHMINMVQYGFNRKWTKEKCIEDAKKYKRNIDWYKNSQSAWIIAWKNGWITDCRSHMIESDQPQKYKGYWTKERCIKDALKYKTKVEWRINSSTARTIAQRKGWIKEITHFVKKI